jgi:hypothetical protein
LRYYKIIITDENGEPVTDAAGNPIGPYMSHVGERPIRGALNVELNIPSFTFDQPTGGGFFRIWGLGLWVVSQGADLNGKKIQVFAGFLGGLPLSRRQPTPGIILQGVIQQAYAVWDGTIQTLDLIIQGDYGTVNDQKNIVFDCPAGAHLSDSIAAALKTAFPEFDVDASGLSPDLVTLSPLPGYYGTLSEFATWLNQETRGIIGGDTYRGVKISFKDGGLKVFDGTTKDDPLQIGFKDLVGQATWLDFGTLSFAAMLRSDMQVGDYVKLPEQLFAQNTPQSNSQYRNKSVFQGTFLITQVRHLGNFRQTAASNDWITQYEVVQVDDNG